MIAPHKAPRMTGDVERQLQSHEDAETPFLVRKLGRTTSATKGRLNEVACHIKYDTGSQGGYEIRTKVFVALGIKHSSPFATYGDSGSLVVDENSAPVGLLIACHSVLGRPHHAALITPIEDIINDMERAINVLEGEKTGSNPFVKIELL